MALDVCRGCARILARVSVRHPAGSVDRAGDPGALGLAAVGAHRREVAGGVSSRTPVAGRGAPVCPQSHSRAAPIGRGAFWKTMIISKIRALEILDSRGNPTLSVQVQ